MAKSTANSFSGTVDWFPKEVYRYAFKEGRDDVEEDYQYKEPIPEMDYFNKQLFTDFNPDINGYTLVFLIPPEFALLKNRSNPYFDYIRKFVTFAATDFTPPSVQVTTSQLQTRSGAIPYADEIAPGEQCSVTYLDDDALSIYSFHNLWIHYIHELLIGDKHSHDLNYEDGSPFKDYLDYKSSHYGALDYMGSLYVVRYDPTFTTMLYIGKATGVFPQGMPSKEVIGQRASNELTTVPFQYVSTYYEESTNYQHPIYDEFYEHVRTFFE